MTESFINMPNLNAMVDDLAVIGQRKNNPAGYMHERIIRMIERHQRSLSDDYELGLQVVGGGAPPFHLRSISYSNPDILLFVGKDADGNVMQVMQHHSQMSIVIVGLKKLDDTAYRIGFTSTT